MKLNKKSIFIVSATALIITAASVMLSLFSTTKPSKVARTFLEDLSKKETETAYNMTSTQFQATVTKETFNDFLALYPILTAKTEIDFSEHSVDDDVATFSGNIKGKDGSQTPITMHIIKEKDGWKVLALSLNPVDSPQNQNRGLASEEEKQ